jgi:hypothetical protein
MNARSCRLVLIWCFSALAVATSAEAQSNLIFGLGNASITPPSGVATPVDVLNVQLSGVNGDTNVPQNISVTPLGPGAFLILLTTPGSAGATIPTPWNQQTTHGPLAAGTYDFHVRGIVGFGTPNEFVLGTQLLFDNFVVVPEPAAALLAAAVLMSLNHFRRRG